MLLEQIDQFYKLAKETPVFMYHGTSLAALPSILSQGLIPNPKVRKWNEYDSCYEEPSLTSLEGVYLTPNIEIAIHEAFNAKEKDSIKQMHRVIVLVQVQTKSVFLDEDNIKLHYPDYKDYAQDMPLYKAINAFYDIKSGVDLSQYKDQYAKKLVNLAFKKIKEPNEKLVNYIYKLFYDNYELAILRKVANIRKDQYELFTKEYEVKYDQPDINEVEGKFKEYQDNVTRALKSLAEVLKSNRESKFNVRVPTPIRYTKSNKIVAIVDLVPDWGSGDKPRPVKMIYPNSISELAKMSPKGYDKLMEDLHASVASEISFV
jgi:hypothetical protein